MFSETLAKIKNETKIKTSLRARGPPGVSGALRSVRILRIGRIGSVCSILNKILSHVIWKSFSFSFYSNLKKTSQHFWNWGCTNRLQCYIDNRCSCGSVVEHCVSSAKCRGFNSQGTHILRKECIAWMHCKSLWIKASAKCKCNVM